MDLGFADATAVVTGGSKGMGRAVAEVLAADGARVAVMARGRAALDDTVTALHSLGSPDAVGISVDMTDPASIASRLPRGRRSLGIAQRPGAHDRTGCGAVRGPGRRRLGPGLCPRHDVRGAQRPRRRPLLRAAEWARVGDLLGPFHSATEPHTGGLHGVEGRRDERGQESRQVPGSRRHPRQRGLSRLHRHGQLHREPAGDLRRRGPRPGRSARRHASGSSRRSTSRPTSGGPGSPTRWHPSPPTSCRAGTAT